MPRRYREGSKPVYGAYASKSFHRRPGGAIAKIAHIPSREFCDQYGISLHVAYRLCQIKKLISGIRRGGIWYYALIPGCEDTFEAYLFRNRNMRGARVKK